MSWKRLSEVGPRQEDFKKTQDNLLETSCGSLAGEQLLVERIG